MTTIFVVVCVLLAIYNVILLLPRKRKKQQRRDYIREHRIKILWNPFTQVWMWTRLNPANHHWEWQREATTAELARYMIHTNDGTEPPNNMVFFRNEGIEPSEVNTNG